MAKKRSVSTSRADRTEEKIKREKIKNSPRRPFGYPTNKKEALASATGVAAGAAIVAAKSAMKKPPKGGNLYRANQARNLKAVGPIQKGMSKEDLLRSNRKAAIDLARAGKIQSKTAIKGAKGSGWGSGLKKDDIRVTIKDARKGQGMGSSRYGRLTGGGAAPGRGMGQGGSGGGGFLKRSK